MMTLFNREQVLEAYVNEREEAAAQKAKNSQAKEAAIIMYQNNTTLDVIAAAFKVSIATVQQWLGLVKA